MKKRYILLIAFFVPLFVHSQEIYEIRTYELDFFKNPTVLHDYLEKSLIPALNRQGVKKVGAFEEAGDALPKKMYVMIAYPNMSTFAEVASNLAADATYQSDAKSYLTAPPAEIPFKRISTALVRASKGFPSLAVPDNASFYELRIYEAYNEDALRRKVKMFDDHEFEIFDDVGLPMVFFGANLTGNQTPCLSYLLAFDSKEAHGAAWQKFGPHPEWQRIIRLEEYANTVSSITRVFLKPLGYSQF